MKKNAADFISECKKLGIDPKIEDEAFNRLFVGAAESWTVKGQSAQGFLVRLADLMTKADKRNPTKSALKKKFDTLRRLVEPNLNPADYYEFETVLDISKPLWLIENENEVLVTNAGKDWLEGPKHPTTDPVYVQMLTKFLS